MPGLFIAGTGTDVGKTYVTAALIRALIAGGQPVEPLKPVLSGFDPEAAEASDSALLLKAAGIAWTPQTLDHISPWRFTAPLSPPLAARREGKILDAAAVTALCRARIAEATNRLLIIEAAGGVMSPLDDDHTMLDLATGLGLPVLLVAGSYLGTISHTLTAVAVLRAAGVPLLAIALSESLNAPPLPETLESLQRLLPGLPTVAVPRNAQVPDVLVRLAVEAAA